LLFEDLGNKKAGKTPEFEGLGNKNQSNTQVVGVKTGVGLSSCGA